MFSDEYGLTLLASRTGENNLTYGSTTSNRMAHIQDS